MSDDVILIDAEVEVENTEVPALLSSGDQEIPANVNSVIGTGITNVVQTVVSSDPDIPNEITIYLSNGEEYPFYVRNGQDGGGGGGGTSDYDQLSNRPQINSTTLTGNKSASDLGLATTAQVNAKYTKPNDGIPKNDLASDVQISLGKADTALQSAPVTSVNGQTGAVTIGNATTSAAGLMSATDKSHLDDVYADYSSALAALGV